MAIQTFVADTILTAAQMNALQGNDYNQTVSTKTASYTLVAADKGTRVVMNSASATTITVNTSLFSAGDTLTILNISTGVCTVTAGTATVSTTGSLALAQNGGGTLYFTSTGVAVFQADGVTASVGGFVPIVPSSIAVGGGTATASANGQVTMTSVTTSILLNGVFSATYTNYRILFQATGSSAYSLTARLSVGGTASTATEYRGNVLYGTASAAGAANAAAGTSWSLSLTGTTQKFLTVDVSKPFVVGQTFFVGTFGEINTAGTTGGVANVADYYQLTTSFDGIQFLTDYALTGTISVYGYTI